MGRQKQALRTAVLEATETRRGRWFLLAPTVATHRVDLGGAVRAAAHLPGVEGRLVRRAVLKTIIAVMPPWTVRVAGEDRRGGTTRIELTKAGGSIHFDPGAHLVIHHRGSPVPADYAARRSAVARHLPAPAFVVRRGGLEVRETLVHGRPLSECGRGTRLAVAHDLIARHTRLVADRAAGTSEQLIRSTLEAVAGADLPSDLRGAVGQLRERLGDQPAGWPAVTSHGDVTLGNIVVDAAGSYALIDFEDSRELPYFHDVVSLLIQDPALWSAALAGVFDTALDRLRRAAGATEPLDLVLAAQTAATVAAHAHASSYGGDLAFALRRTWRDRAEVDTGSSQLRSLSHSVRGTDL